MPPETTPTAPAPTGSGYSFFGSGDFSSSLTSGLNIVTGLFQSSREKQKQQYELELAELQTKRASLGGDYQIKLAELNQRYAALQLDGKDEARDDWRPVIYVAVGATVLLVLVFLVTRKK